MADKTKPKIKQVSEKNEIIRSLSGLDYVKNPIVYSQIRGDFTLMQSKVIISLLSSIQQKIGECIIDGRGIVGPIVSTSNPEFRIELQDLQLKTNQYKDLETACESLRTMGIGFSYKEGSETRYKKMSVFTGYDVPKVDTKSGRERRKGYLKISLNSDAVDYLFNSSNQYIEHISNIALISHSPRTPRLYLYLSAFRKTTSERVVSYDAVKEFLGFLDYNADHTKVKEDRAPKYSLFKRDVIDPAQKELKKLCDQGKVDFYFIYEPVYKTRKTRGAEPDQIRFILIQGNGNNKMLSSEEAVEVIPIDKPTSLTGSTLKDHQLMKQLAKTDEWAAQALTDAADGKEWNIDEFRQHLESHGIAY